MGVGWADSGREGAWGDGGSDGGAAGGGGGRQADFGGEIHLHPVERSGIVVGLDKILADFWAHNLEDVAHPPKDREVAEDGVAGLAHVPESKQPVHANDTSDDQRFLAYA